MSHLTPPSSLPMAALRWRLWYIFLQTMWLRTWKVSVLNLVVLMIMWSLQNQWLPLQSLIMMVRILVATTVLKEAIVFISSGILYIFGTKECKLCRRYSQTSLTTHNTLWCKASRYVYTSGLYITCHNKSNIIAGWRWVRLYEWSYHKLGLYSNKILPWRCSYIFPDAVVVFSPTEYTVTEDVRRMSLFIELLTSTGRQLEYSLNTSSGNATGAELVWQCMMINDN